jgi:hypothetical protein
VAFDAKHLLAIRREDWLAVLSEFYRRRAVGLSKESEARRARCRAPVIERNQTAVRCNIPQGCIVEPAQVAFLLVFIRRSQELQSASPRFFRKQYSPIARHIVQPENAGEAKHHTLFSLERESDHFVCPSLRPGRPYPDLFTRWRPCQTLRTDKCRRAEQLLSIAVHGNHPTCIAIHRTKFDKCHSIAAWRDSQVSERLCALIEHLPPRELHAVLSLNLQDERHLAAVGAPIGGQRAVGNFPRRASSKGYQTQGSLAKTDIAVFTTS